ncbi:MAG: ACT domain-containing protein [Bacillota bacterium]
MDRDSSANLYVIKAGALTDSLRKTVEAKELLQQQKAATVNEAVRRVGMSRSVFYKYRDSIFPFHEKSRGKTVTLGLVLVDKPGVLSVVLEQVARVGGNVLTINQDLPNDGTASVSLSIRTAKMRAGIEALVSKLAATRGVQEVRIQAQE